MSPYAIRQGTLPYVLKTTIALLHNGTGIASNILEILVLDELHDDVLLGLDLQHLQREAEEGGGFDVPSVNPPDELQLHGLVHHQLG